MQPLFSIDETLLHYEFMKKIAMKSHLNSKYFGFII